MAETLPALLESHRDEIKALLPKYIDVERFIMNARVIDEDRNLTGCSVQSKFKCIMEAARRGWEIGGTSKHCAAAPFELTNGGQTAILLPQWQGRAFTWTKSGAIKKLRAKTVYVWDEFSYDAGADKISHVPDLDNEHSPKDLNDIKNIKAAYAIATLWSGEEVTSVVTRNDCLRAMEFVKKKNKGKLGFGWTDWVPEQCRKTAVNRLEGFIQPPPDMTPEQLDAWQRASVPAYDVETTAIESRADEIDNPPPLTPEVVAPETSAASIGTESSEYKDIMSFAKAAGVKMGELCNLAEMKFSVSGPDELTAAQVPHFIKEMQAVAGAGAGK